MTFLAENAILSAAIELMELAAAPFESDKEIEFLHDVFRRTGHLYGDEMDYEAYMDLTLQLVCAGAGRLERWREEHSRLDAESRPLDGLFAWPNLASPAIYRRAGKP